MFKKYLMLVLMVFLTACEHSEPFGNDQYGAPIPASWLAEQWLVINYWAVWCAPCRQEIPELNQLHSELAENGVRVLGVNYDQLQGDALLADSQRLQIAFPVLSRDPAPRFKLPPTRGLPSTYLVNPQGVLVGELRGEQTQQSIVDALRQAGWSAR